LSGGGDDVQQKYTARAVRYDLAVGRGSSHRDENETANESDNDAFAEEMRDVVPLSPDPRGRIAAPKSDGARPRKAPDDEAYDELGALVAGQGAFDITATDEYVEGLGPGVDRRLLKKLRDGEFAVQGHLDLHGHTSAEARPEVERFLDGARAAQKRCVLIIHGRGHGSKEGVPVLKERLQGWLSRGRIGKGVLAFCTARPADGGAGAVYVLLRR
jgi:DNA-nicking Smr family endonuclease